MDLPYRGLGLSTNLNASQEPNPWRLLEEAPGLFDYVEYSAPLELEEARAKASLFGELWEKREQLPALFHPVHLNLYGPALETSEQLRALDAHARAVGSAWVGNDVGWWHEDGEPFPGFLYIAPPLNEVGLADAVAHARHVQAHLSMPLVLENPAVIAVHGSMHVLDFMAKLHQRTGCPLLIDLGHLFSYQLARGLPLDAGLDGFPLDQVAEVHLAGGVVSASGGRRIYLDDHTQPVREELFTLLERMLPGLTGLRALTFEGDGHPRAIAEITLRRLRRLVPPPEAGLLPALPAERKISEHVESNWEPASSPQKLFEELYGISLATEDEAGIRAEQDFRLAVMAQHLDRRYPLTRLLLAPDRAALLGFVRSEAFGACFLAHRGTVERAFNVWAIGQARARKDRALEAVLAVESFRARAGKVALPGMGGVDLREAEFAARALRRHLCDRAWVSGELEHSALEALWQIIRRAAAPVLS